MGSAEITGRLNKNMIQYSAVIISICGKSYVDFVFACANQKSLPIDTIMGTIISCDADDDTPVMRKVIVKPVVDLERLSHVLVISPQRPPSSLRQN